jgi:hypothetical protein
MEQPQRGRRRADRASDPTLLDRMAELPTADVRRLRDECREEELGLSYARRLLQGRLDIARAELARRAGDPEAAESLVDALPSILADAPSGEQRDPRNVAFYSPAEEAGRRMADGLVQDASLGRVPDLDDDAVQELVGRLTEAERQTSELRTAVLRNLDGLQGELVRRYRRGEVAVDDVMQAAADRMGGAGDNAT